MDRPQLPLNALRTFEVAARQGSFTQAAVELCVTQAAVSHQIIGLEQLLGVQLFNRTSKGLVLTDEGSLLLPSLTQSLDTIGTLLDRVREGRFRETLNIGAVTTFAVGMLLPNLQRFQTLHPSIDVRLFTNNNRVDLAREGLDMAIRFGDGLWPGLRVIPLPATPFTPVCAPRIADRLRTPADLAAMPLLRSYRADEWDLWFAACGLPCPGLRGPVLDSSLAIAELAEAGAGIGLVPIAMFAERLRAGRLVAPLQQKVTLGRYWITMQRSREHSTAMEPFCDWLEQIMMSEKQD
ncbi:LysR family transcriptional regulator [Paracoccus sp. 11-3]|uniref:LysR family transcriptional regulator n=1 Tax=Paracoccus amoyensis TaxID=2760093 RepID=A0A926JA58_9RHOB|nr:LysR family transcriptional regulator [Paracoccus amoyensis]MBC9245696.1 LysR family transcriptional regulator [Paracoccus amoyensis]